MKKKIFQNGKRAAALLLAVMMLVCALPGGWTAKAEEPADGKTDIDACTFTAEAQTYNAKEVDLGTVTINVTGTDAPTDFAYGTDYTLEAAADTTVRNAGDYELTMKPVDGSNYTFTEKKIRFNIQPCGAADLTVELSANSAKWNNADIDFPNVMIKCGDVDVSGEFDTAFYLNDVKVEKAKDQGTYTLKISSKETAANFTGKDVEKGKFQVEYDASVTVDNVEITGVFQQDGKYYYKDATAVHFTAKDGYSIAEPVTNGTLENGSVNLTDGAETVTFFVLKNGDDVSGNQVTISGLTKDADAPTLTVKLNYGAEQEIDGVKWVTEIVSADMNVTDGGSGEGTIYYSDHKDKNTPDKMMEYSSDVLKTLESETTYYFLATDRAGNVSAIQEITTPKLDTVGPVITVMDGTSKIENDATVYYNKDALTGGKKEFAVTWEDAGVGVDDTSQTPVTTFTPQNEAADEKKDITNTVTDRLGNTSTHTFHVVYDTTAPVISDVKASTDAANTGVTEENGKIKVLTSEPVTITAKVTDENLNEKGVVLVSEDGTVKKTMTKGADDNWSVTLEAGDTGFLQGIWHIEASDLAGNTAEDTKTIQVYIETAAPTITEITIDQTKNNGWFNKDITFRFDVAPQEGRAKDKDYSWKIMYRKTADGAWQEVLDNKGTTLTETDETFDGTYEFKVVDNLGNETAEESMKSIPVKKDKKAPESDEIYVTYVNDENESSEEKKNFFDTIAEFFGKKNITVHLYVPQDEISGVNDITYYYCDAEKKNPQTQKVNEGYTVTIGNRSFVEFEILLPWKGLEKTGEEMSDYLEISKVTDKAGNATDITSPVQDVPKGSTLLIIDNVNPTVAFDYSKAAAETANADSARKYYKRAGAETKNEIITLTFVERFYKKKLDQKGEIARPVIQLNGTDYAAEFEDAEGEFTATVKLPYVDGEETEYIITAKYTDESGNDLDLAANVPGNKVSADEVSSLIYVLDDKAPELTSFSITSVQNTEPVLVNGVRVYPNLPNEEDVKIAFTIAETKAYWQENHYSLEIHNVDTGDIVKGGDIKCEKTQDDNSITYVYSFDGAADPASYVAKVTYRDRAGHEMILPDDMNTVNSDSRTIENGTYTSDPFILDHANPTINVTYAKKAHRIVKESDLSKTEKNQNPKYGYTAYYNTDIQVTFTIKEEYAVYTQGDKNPLTGFGLQVNQSTNNLPEITWSQNGNVYTGTFTLTQENNYNFTISYTDAAGNSILCKNGGKESDPDEEFYQSSALVLDKTAPVVKTSYVDQESGAELQPNNTYKNRKYFKQKVYLKYEIDDKNVLVSDWKKTALDDFKAFRIDGAKIDDKTKKMIQAIRGTQIIAKHTFKIPLEEQCNYDIPIVCEDLAGNKTVCATEYAGIDTSKPQNVKFSYTVTKAGFKDAVNYKDFGFMFADHKLELKASAEDEITGIQYIIFTVTDENGKEKVITKTFDPASSKSAKVAIPQSGSDFNGDVKVKIVDFAANSTKKTQSQIVETAEKHQSAGSAVIKTKTEPSRTVDGEDYYNSDVIFNLTLKDTYSGLRSYEYTAGSQISEKHDYAAEAGNNLDEKQNMEITREYSKDLTLVSTANNKNEVEVKASYTDNAGHTGKTEEKYNIDITAPVIDVSYDLNDPANEKYYNATRTATVVITERNFDENDVEFTITNTDGAMPSISGWSTSGTGDDTKHTANVTFSEDGDYTFTLSFVDLAGNKAKYDIEDEFTIDQTKPEYTVSYDNDAAQNEYYYADQRTATIDILEHNFDPALVTVTITSDGASSGSSSVSGWSKNGDHNTATIAFAADAEYTFTFTGMDMAENEMEAYTTDHFVVDTTEPEIEIFDIESMSANNGVVQPGIRYSDTNYDANATEVEMVGAHNGKIEMNGTTATTATGVELKLNDFEHVQEMDDLYTMKATVYDLAGNSSEAEVIFSVNRFGSVYTFDSATDDLVGENGKYYTNEEQDIVVVETNVDSLEFKEITCNLNGELETLKEGEDYQVEESGSDVSWKQYTYRMDKSTFESEGTYMLTIYSEDRAANTSDNSSKGKKVEFVVDKTKPSVLVSGIEDNGQYRQDSREITVDVEDNVRLADVSVNVDGKQMKFSSEDVANADGKLTLPISSKNSWQKLSVTAYDAAGNNNATQEIRYLITSNFFIQLYANRPVFFGLLGGIAVIAGGAGWFVFAAKRKKKEEA